MKRYVIKRILLALLITIITSIFAFSLLHILPGDPARLALGFEASEEDVQALREQLNLDKPIVTQYLLWVSGLLTGQAGYSIVFKMPINYMLHTYLPRTLAIGIPALIIAAPIGVVIGVVCAVRRGRLVDKVLTVFNTTIMGMPVFWLGILAVFWFGAKLKLLPVQGYVAPTEDFHEYLRHAILPIICMALGMITTICRNTRTYVIDAINADYIRTARANGLSELSIIFKHALKNALIPILTVIGMQVRTAIGGALIIERIFNIPGLGMLATDSVIARDYQVVMLCVLVMALFTIVANMVVDILYGFVDPRIKYSSR
ncbi:MAG: ABC transporter permease [Bacillota bacterium]|nr:ABC transporter permease [Bacillota bacterium]